MLLGQGDGTFAAKMDYPVGGSLISLTTGDWNGDGRLDLAVTNESAVNVLLGQGDGSFAPKAEYGTGGLPEPVVAGDLNRDGRLDLAVTNRNNLTVGVLLNSCWGRASNTGGSGQGGVGNQAGAATSGSGG